MDKRCQHDRKYLAVLDPRHGAYRPRTGLAEGWVPARVAKDQTATGHSNQVSIEYAWPHFYTKQGRLADNRQNYTEFFQLGDVRRASDFSTGASPWNVLVPPSLQPDLAIIAFRWGGLTDISFCAQWGETGVSSSDTFLESFIDSAVVKQLGTNYEVWVVYVEDHSDMAKMAETAHLIFGPHHPARRAKRTCGMYFLYPTAFEEGCVPTMETGGDSGAGLVDQKSLFRLMQAVERAGIPTRFPHCSGLYEQLASKRWTHILSLTPHLRVPPTVAVPRMLIEQSCAGAAERALKSLQLVKEQQAILRGEAVPDGPIEKGVAKLSFSWEALDVKCWTGKSGLQDALSQLTQSIEISKELTGQPHDCEVLLVQEFMQHDLELRLYVVDGRIEGSVFTKFCCIKENLEFGDFKQSFSKAEAARNWMGGDMATMDDGERQCRELTEHWLAWIQAQSCEMPPAIRFDYFVGRTSTPGRASVWTLEICELGFSMLAHKQLPEKVFAAMLASCLRSPAAQETANLEVGPEAKRRRQVEV